MPLTLLQVTITPGDTILAAPPPAEPMTMLDILTRGGWVMVPIALISVVAVYLFVERLLVLKRARMDPQRFMQNVGTYVRGGDISGAVGYCRAHDTPISRILHRGLERLGRPIGEIQDAVQAAGRHETYDLEKRTDLLASSAAIAPMLGFLGTVIGMIRAFQEVQLLEGAASPAALASGIWEALVTTAFGLAVGILALFFYNFLLNRIARAVNDMERAATEFIDLLQSPAEAQERRRVAV